MEHYKEFAETHGQGDMAAVAAKSEQWAADFDLEAVPDIPQADLPPQLPKVNCWDAYNSARLVGMARRFPTACALQWSGKSSDKLCCQGCDYCAKSVQSALTCVVGNSNRPVQKKMLCMQCEPSNAASCCVFCEGSYVLTGSQQMLAGSIGKQARQQVTNKL